jgi:hypothetical protein
MNLRPDGRIDSVCCDQAISTDLMAALKSCDNAVGILFERFHALSRHQATFRQLPPKRLMEVGPVYAQGRGLKPRHSDRGDQPSIWPVEVELGDRLTAGKHRFKHA